ncbi:hypothetical protein VP01_212g1 [Puccinia sorghi]|uniref:Uncharacterized protein n=1 Tax=Puccinia sorghi TaxID=27349 RepID=A0A0L6VA00_9BASI|nr:hypothetical protein VP01_212g1 [Puccinia sorghi]
MWHINMNPTTNSLLAPHTVQEGVCTLSNQLNTGLNKYTTPHWNRYLIISNQKAGRPIQNSRKTSHYIRQTSFGRQANILKRNTSNRNEIKKHIVIQPSLDAQSLCRLHSVCTKTSTHANSIPSFLLAQVLGFVYWFEGIIPREYACIQPPMLLISIFICCKIHEGGGSSLTPENFILGRKWQVTTPFDSKKLHFKKNVLVVIYKLHGTTVILHCTALHDIIIPNHYILFLPEMIAQLLSHQQKLLTIFYKRGSPLICFESFTHSIHPIILFNLALGVKPGTNLLTDVHTELNDTSPKSLNGGTNPQTMAIICILTYKEKGFSIKNRNITVSTAYMACISQLSMELKSGSNDSSSFLDERIIDLTGLLNEGIIQFQKTAERRVYFIENCKLLFFGEKSREGSLLVGKIGKIKCCGNVMLCRLPSKVVFKSPLLVKIDMRGGRIKNVWELCNSVWHISRIFRRFSKFGNCVAIPGIFEVKKYFYEIIQINADFEILQFSKITHPGRIRCVFGSDTKKQGCLYICNIKRRRSYKYTRRKKYLYIFFIDSNIPNYWFLIGYLFFAALRSPFLWCVLRNNNGTIKGNYFLIIDWFLNVDLLNLICPIVIKLNNSKNAWVYDREIFTCRYIWPRCTCGLVSILNTLKGEIRQNMWIASVSRVFFSNQIMHLESFLPFLPMVDGINAEWLVFTGRNYFSSSVTSKINH